MVKKAAITRVGDTLYLHNEWALEKSKHALRADNFVSLMIGIANLFEQEDFLEALGSAVDEAGIDPEPK